MTVIISIHSCRAAAAHCSSKIAVGRREQARLLAQLLGDVGLRGRRGYFCLKRNRAHSPSSLELFTLPINIYDNVIAWGSETAYRNRRIVIKGPRVATVAFRRFNDPSKSYVVPFVVTKYMPRCTYSTGRDVNGQRWRAIRREIPSALRLF